MELDITRYFLKGEKNINSDVSVSVATHGKQASKIGWNNALEASDLKLLDTEKKIENTRDFFSGFGAWSDDELSDKSNIELEALLIQYCANEISEATRYYESEYKIREPFNTLDVFYNLQDDRDWTDNRAGHVFLGSDDNLYVYVGV